MTSLVLSFNVSVPVAEELRRLAQEAGRDISALVEEALAEYIQRRNWEMGVVEEGIRGADAGAFISHEAMVAWLKSWGTENALDPPEPDVFKRATKSSDLPR